MTLYYLSQCYLIAVAIRQKQFTGTKGLCLDSQHQKGSVQHTWEVLAIRTCHPVLTSMRFSRAHLVTEDSVVEKTGWNWKWEQLSRLTSPGPFVSQSQISMVSQSPKAVTPARDQVIKYLSLWGKRNIHIQTKTQSHNQSYMPCQTVFGMVEEITQLGKCLSHKHGYWNLDAQHSHKNLGLTVCVYLSSAGKVFVGGILGACESVKLRQRARLKNKAESERGTLLIPTSRCHKHLYICACALVYTCAHTDTHTQRLMHTHNIKSLGDALPLSSHCACLCFWALAQQRHKCSSLTRAAWLSRAVLLTTSYMC